MELPEQTDTAPAEGKPALSPVGAPGVSCPEPVHAGSTGIPHILSERERSVDAPDTIPRDEDLPEYRPVVPADPDIPLVPQEELTTGAGTDVPMVWNRSREWKKPAGQPSAQPVPSNPVSPAPGGLVARIIAFVTGIVRKKRT